MNQKKIGSLIKEKRKEKNLTQQQFSELLGVSPKTISKWETGTGLPDITFLKEISKNLDITIDELLDGKTKEINKIDKNKNNKIFILIILVIFIVVLIIINFLIKIKINNQTELPNNNCTVIRTYYIDNIGKSNDENYLYITIHEYQVEGTYTLKLPIILSKDLKVGSSYEFTFKTNKKYISTTTDKLFNNSEIINLVYSDKVGLDRTSKSYCKGDDINEK